MLTSLFELGGKIYFGGAGDLAGDEGFASAGGFVVEEDAVAAGDVGGLAVAFRVGWVEECWR